MAQVEPTIWDNGTGPLLPPGWTVGGSIAIGPDGQISGTVNTQVGTTVPVQQQQPCNSILGCGGIGASLPILLLLVAVTVLLFRE